MRSSTAEVGVIDVVETLNGPRLWAATNGAIGLFRTEIHRAEEATLSVKDQKSATE